MDPTKHKDALDALVTPSLAAVALAARTSRSKLLSRLLHQRRLPEEGWDDLTVQQLLYELAGYDMNNALECCGVGEREGRVFSNLVRQRHYGMSHGIGRSGDIMALQPKAPGSSTLNILTQALMLDMLHSLGLYRAAAKAIVLPMATGMSLHLCLQYLRSIRPKTAEIVLWSRIDQKSCFKSILTAVPQIISLQQEDASLSTDVSKLRESLERYGANNVLCVMTTTSTFAPRVPDRIPEVARLCAEFAVPHVVNNAYGLQCTKCCHLLEEACGRSVDGRVDFVVQSTDKNFMVPVGGSIVFSPLSERIEGLSRFYPGRASASQAMDLFITLLQLGYRELRQERERLFTIFKEKLLQLSATLPPNTLTVLDTPGNGISIAVKLGKHLITALSQRTNERGEQVNDTACEDASFLGATLFTRRCSGARVIVSTNNETLLSTYKFRNFGSHHDTIFADAYLTVACAVGMKATEIDVFLERLKNVSMKSLRSLSSETRCHDAVHREL